VVTVSRKQVFETVLFREVAEILSKLLGKRLQYKKEKFTSRHTTLRRKLLPKSKWNEDSFIVE
jgi:hypothetical protein